MSPLPDRRPQNLSLGPLETEILDILWELGSATVKDIHQRILADPDRELAYTSVTTILNRLTQKGWLSCDKQQRAFIWKPTISRHEAQLLKSHQQLNRFLEASNPDIVAAFADSLDAASVEQITAIAQRLQALRDRCSEEQP
ncbi:MAG: BlaI/MecI/CopY family transcriptional regulator [Cyanobacteriota bacterium]|nr:BlaI/MecI/CopY family transcriptional regulator [Cyanobacteriota bacterium]